MRIYPPRPEYKIKPDSLDKYDNTQQYLAQPKLNGSYGVLITGADGSHTLFNRHKEEMKLIGKLDLSPLAMRHPDSIILGEYMNKYKLNEEGEKWIDKFVIFDIMQQKGDSFIGYTTKQRREFLIAAFGDLQMYVNDKGEMKSHPYCYPTQFDGVFLIRSYYRKSVSAAISGRRNALRYAYSRNRNGTGSTQGR